MANVFRDIRAAFETQLAGLTGIPDISYENLKYHPSAQSPYVEAILLPTEKKPAVRGLNPQERYEGIFRVICYSPEGSGPGACDELAELILDGFPATSSISYTNSDTVTTNVSVDYAEREAGFLEGAFYYIPVNIGFYVYK